MKALKELFGITANFTSNNSNVSSATGLSSLDHPGLNKDTAFTHEERGRHGLVDLLLDVIEDLDRQFQRAQKNLPIEEYIFLTWLHSKRLGA